jgi:multidrug transporter EmrE-like cation transporter
MRWIVLITAIILNALANVLIKAGMIGSKEEGLINMLKNRWLSLPIISGILCFALALIAYSYVLSKMNLSVAYPIMTSAGFILIGFISWLFFKETITFVQLIGFGFLIIGIWLVAK